MWASDTLKRRTCLDSRFDDAQGVWGRSHRFPFSSESGKKRVHEYLEQRLASWKKKAEDDDEQPRGSAGMKHP